MIEQITANPNILGGKPIIRGTRISVEFILDLLASEVSEREILEDYPHLTKEDIHACLRYAARSCRSRPGSVTLENLWVLQNPSIPFSVISQIEMC